MLKYRSMRCKRVLSLLIGIVCTIGCGSTNFEDPHRREVEIKGSNFREVNSDKPDRGVVEKKSRSGVQTPEQVADKKEYYLDEVAMEKVTNEETNQREYDPNAKAFSRPQHPETYDDSADRRKESERQPAERYDETGTAAFISDEYDGAMTASGGRYDRNEMTAAHPSLPFDTRIVVTNLRNKRSVEVIIIDRFDPSNDRILNVSYRAAEELDLIESGVAKVGIRILTDNVAR